MNATVFKSLRAICNKSMRAAGLREVLDDAAAGTRGVLGHGSEQAALPYIDGDVERIRPLINAFDRCLGEVISKGGKVADLRSKTQRFSSEIEGGYGRRYQMVPNETRFRKVKS